MLGGFAKRMAKKKPEGGDEAPKARATFMTMTNEVLKVGDGRQRGRRRGAGGIQGEPVARVLSDPPTRSPVSRFPSTPRR